ncbi:hypothetical protein SEVIR_2G235100v4 [Setaria viridis]|uniref:C2H2-type domain-containing protein n=2 Tax=Setaria TaxID=4554 RepID=A0A368Q205_SETIT|nr:protein indeterminate-domain 16 isoform X2 [Setaria italica]XP_034578587.1 protein indeterminate-domain 16-like isoform X2 [Setaria viridis]RCV11912.1 hypothetical protein SETIT_2G224800v2 [Setaria italica]TKW33433.1 hypothetical protein SEVIR_2G235100v2 [Setaria viridis]
MLGFCAPAAGSPPDEATPEPFRSLQIATTAAGAAATTKKKRRPAGTPDPDAEVVSLSPRTLLESDRYVCEICGQGFQRDQNLQMHRRRHKVPWKLLKREAGEAARKRVFVCPEPSCLHHDPSHALGDLVGIKKHFRRKHSGHRQWACARCSKAYAVHSDYKAHLKTCGTRGHSCDCGRVFSRVESFIEHQDTCNAGRARADASPACGGGVAAASAGSQQQQAPPPAMSLSRTASSTSPSSDVVISPSAWPGPPMPSPTTAAAFHRFDQVPSPRTLPSEHHRGGGHNLELQLMPPSSSGAGGGALGMAPFYGAPRSPAVSSRGGAGAATQLLLSIGVGSGDAGERGGEAALAAARARQEEEEAREQLRQAAAEKAAADEARAQARRHAELAEQELASAKRMRRQAQVELSRAHALREHAVRQVNATLLQITCLGCRHKFRARPPTLADAGPEVACSYVSSVVTEGGDPEVDEPPPLEADGMRRRRQHAMAMDIVL